MTDIVAATGMKPVDIIHALQGADMLQEADGRQVIVRDEAAIAKHLARPGRRSVGQIDDSKLQWVPFSARPNWA